MDHQKFLVFTIDSAAKIAQIQEVLMEAGFAVHLAGRAVPGLTVRIREGTKDEADATAIVARLAPIEMMPSGSPTTHIWGYRDDQ